MALVRTERLTKSFGALTAVNDVTIEVEAGSLHSIIGPNGAGKTTFFNMLTGVYKPTAGRIVFDGTDVTGKPPHAITERGIGRTFQTEMAIEQLSVFENVAMIHEHSGANRASRRADVVAAIEFVGLEASPSAKVGGLGARERRLVEIARAVVARPRLVLLDEPAAGLPEEETGHLGEVIGKIPEEVGALVILVDHDMSLVSACCNTTAVIDFGRLIAAGPTAEMLRDEHVMRAYLGTETTI